jgi:hypothetical protein
MYFEINDEYECVESTGATEIDLSAVAGAGSMYLLR